MKRDTSFSVIWDSGASHCITPHIRDFVSPLNDPGVLQRVKGLNATLKVKGMGTVRWTMHDEKGGLRHFELTALYVPQCHYRLLSTSSLLQVYKGEHLIQHASFLRLSGNKSFINRASVLVPLDKQSGLLKVVMHRMPAVKDAAICLGQTISKVRSEYLNLSEGEKELLKWHYRLGHLSFRRIQTLLRTGVLSHNESARILHRTSCRIRHPPKCAAC